MEAQTFGMAPTKPSPLEEKKAQIEEIKALQKLEVNFDEEEDLEEKKKIFSVFGLKNDGKTAICYGIPEEGSKIMVLSFDNKSSRPKDLPFIQAGNLTIKVFNAIKHLDKSTPDTYQATSEVTLMYVLQLIDQAKDKFAPDYIVVDATEVMSQIAEQVMRIRNNLRPYQGITNLNVWKERKQYLDDIHMQCTKCAAKGVIYTMYTEKDQLIDKDGVVIRSKDIPKWTGSIMMETDVTIKADTMFDGDKREFFAYVESKIPEEFPNGRFEITNKRIRDVVSSL